VLVEWGEPVVKAVPVGVVAGNVLGVEETWNAISHHVVVPSFVDELVALTTKTVEPAGTTKITEPTVEVCHGLSPYIIYTPYIMAWQLDGLLSGP
jgi:hypothetical protein